ncbi:hypothetical protein B0T24DRAFT_594910 [Lasiosphaeria ovina]|uniref:Ankyrin repeat protein n=1 Tax=Lasiosphaeria ovina TaxID=92902 RepID=A0AAE0K7N7_9PEZI|nr:hypothetical protein B0T24DRAFT_594910 [Lasiosphaeria ovina]
MDHIDNLKAWPDVLLQLVQCDASTEEVLDLIRRHLVMLEAASKNRKEIIEELLKDKVHPDVRVRGEDKTASSRTTCPAIRKLLSQYGAKSFSSSPRWKRWETLDNSDDKDDEQDTGIDDGEKGMHEFRGLVVDIYYPSSSTASDEENPGLPTAAKQQPRAEFHRIAHPTVEELVYEKGPGKIMGSDEPTWPRGSTADDYQRLRWIHLPMNHLIFLVVDDMAKNCPNREAHERQGEGSSRNPGWRRASTQPCSDKCKKTNGEKFPPLYGRVDSIFEARYWLGHQNTRGTEEHSHIRYLRPQFRRLGMGKCAKLALLPYVHFDTYEAVLRLKQKAAELKKARIDKLDSNKPIKLNDNDKTWESDTGGIKLYGSDEPELARIVKDSEGRVPSTTLGVIHKDLYGLLPVHYRRTLSQFYFNTELQKTKQVVTEHFETEWADTGRDPLTLMVDQLWMLVLVNGTIITCFPSQMQGLQQIFPYIYTDIVEGLLASLRSEWRSPIECIGFLFNQRARYNVCFRFLNIYEHQLSKVAACEADWFKKLSDIVINLDPTDANYEKKAQECLKKLLQLEKSMDVMAKMNKLKHIRRELDILMEVVTTQVRVMKQMTDELEGEEFAWKGFVKSPSLKSRRQRRAEKLETRKQTISKLYTKAETIIHDLYQLELFITRKEQQVQNLQSYFSSRLSNRSTRMEVIILVLTGVTTVFVPLSFITAFLALQVTEYPHAGDQVSLPISFAITWVVGVGGPVVLFIIIISTMAVAFDLLAPARWLWGIVRQVGP